MNLDATSSSFAGPVILFLKLVYNGYNEAVMILR